MRQVCHRIHTLWEQVIFEENDQAFVCKRPAGELLTYGFEAICFNAPFDEITPGLTAECDLIFLGDYAPGYTTFEVQETHWWDRLLADPLAAIMEKLL